MMRNLADLPIFPLSALREADRVRIENEFRVDLRRYGASSYNAGMSRADCPPFSQADASSCWCSGWYDEHARHFHSADRAAARKRCTPECHHNEDAKPWLFRR